jgi:hypothetical protein
MAYPRIANFSDGLPGSAWWIVRDTRYFGNAATYLAAVRRALALPATARDLKYDVPLLLALRDRARILSARGLSGWDRIARDLPTDRMSVGALIVGAYLASGGEAAGDIAELALSEDVAVPRLGDLAYGAVGQLQSTPHAGEPTADGNLPNIFGEESLPQWANTGTAAVSSVARRLGLPSSRIAQGTKDTKVSATSGLVIPLAVGLGAAGLIYLALRGASAPRARRRR